MDRVSASGFRGRRFESQRRQNFFLFIDKFTNYFQTFIYISLSFLYVFFVSSLVNACISEFDLLLSTYSKWLYNDQFRSYLVYMYIAYFHITHFPNLIILIVIKFIPYRKVSCFHMWLNCESTVDQVWIVCKFYFSNVTLWDQLWNIFKPEIPRLD